MAYNFNYPYPYQPNQFFNQNQQSIQANNNFIIAHNEQEVLNYPVACGNSINFKIENAPYLYTKTMGFSQFDKPVIEKYRLLKEELGGTVEEVKTNPVEDKLKSMQDTIETFEGRLSSLQSELKLLKEQRRNKNEHNANGKSV